MKTNLKELFEQGEYKTAIEHLADRGIKATLREDKKIVCEQADYERAVATLDKAYKWGEINSPMTVTTLLEHFSLESIVKRFPKEINDWKQGNDFSDDLFHALYDYYFDEMPYGTKKARDGDPYEWISHRLEQDLDVGMSDEDMGDAGDDMMSDTGHQEVEEANGAHMFVIGDTVYYDNKKGVVDRQEGNKVFVHTGDGDMDVFPADETSLTRQGAIPTMRKHINQIARGMKGFITGRPELEEAKNPAQQAAIAIAKKKKGELEEGSYLPDGYGDYSKGATNPDGTASAQRQRDREFDRLEYERKEKERKEKGVKEDIGEESNGPIVYLHKAYPENIAKAKATLEKFHSVDGQPLKVSPPSGKHGPDYVEIHLEKKPYNSIDAIKSSLKNEGVKYGAVKESSMGEGAGHTATDSNIDAIKRLAGLSR